MNGDRDPTIADVLDELRSFRRAVLDEIAGLRHYVQAWTATSPRSSATTPRAKRNERRETAQ